MLRSAQTHPFGRFFVSQLNDVQAMSRQRKNTMNCYQPESLKNMLNITVVKTTNRPTSRHHEGCEHHHSKEKSQFPKNVADVWMRYCVKERGSCSTNVGGDCIEQNARLHFFFHRSDVHVRKVDCTGICVISDRLVVCLGAGLKTITAGENSARRELNRIDEFAASPTGRQRGTAPFKSSHQLVSALHDWDHFSWSAQ